MNKNKILITFLLLIFLFQCSPIKQHNLGISDEKLINDLKLIISNHSQFKNVWNFNQAIFESINKLSIKLIDSIENQQVIIVDGYTGCSFNCCSGKLILIYDLDKGDLINVYQVSNQIEFIDLNNDSIMEIYSKNCHMWMGEYGEKHTVYSLNLETPFFSQYNSSPKSFDENFIQLKDNNEFLLYESELKFIDTNHDSIKDIIVISKYQHWDDDSIYNKIDTILVNPF